MTCVNSVRIYPETITLETGCWYYQAYAEVCPENADCKEVTWYSDDPAIASVNYSSGYIYARSVGVTRIHAMATDGSGCCDYLTVTVKKSVPVRSVTLDHSYLSLEKGTDVTLHATVCPENATNRRLNWHSNNPNVATVSNGGTVTAISKGSTIITATAADGSLACDCCNVTVTTDILVTSVNVVPSSKTMPVGTSAFLDAILCPTNAAKPYVSWSSANESIATVNPSSGLVYAKSPGTVVIYATAIDGGGVCGCCTVRVVPVYVQDITVCPETLTLSIGKHACLEAIVCPANATNRNISWVSGDCNIADVDANGCVTGKAAGTTRIYAYATDGSGVHGCCEVMCNILNVDSIGVFQKLSTLSVTPDDTKVEVPVLLGLQFTEPQNGTYRMRIVSQIKTLDYKYIGYEIYSKFDDDAPVPNILFSNVAYTSLIAAKKNVYPTEGFNYFVVSVIENIPENSIASFNIIPFAITLEEQYLYGPTTLFSCKAAEQIDNVAFEIPEHSGTSAHIYDAALSKDKNNYTFTCAFSQCNDSFTVPKDQVVGSYVTNSTDPRLGNSQTPLAYGIDVSKHQGDISQSQWNEIANTQIDGHTITFAILRIGSELLPINGDINRQKDPYFERNYERAKAAGLQVGCYYYTGSWSRKNAIGDAEQVIEWIGDKQFEYPIFFDIEDKKIADPKNVPNNTVRTEICTAFINKMREEGFFAGFYTNNNWIKNLLNSSTLLPKYDFWYARYYDNTPNNWQSDWAGAGRKFDMWQYTKTKHIPPISGNVDCDVAYKNYPLIIKSLHLNNFK